MTLTDWYTEDENATDHGGDDWIISSDTEIEGEHYNIGKLKIESDVVATIPEPDSDYNYFRAYADEIVINGTIDGDGAGFAETEGDGADGDNGYGGTYGGKGGRNDVDEVGSEELDEYAGSGGHNTGGRGGAAVVLCAPDITVAGTIKVNGLDGDDNGDGGGAGGLIMLYGKNVDISDGTLQADGGEGKTNTSTDEYGGGGGGGRLKIFNATYSNTDATLSVEGGYATSYPGEDGIITEEKIGTVKGGYPYGQKFYLTNTGRAMVDNVVLDVTSVESSGSFTVAMYDDDEKSKKLAEETITISTTGEKTVTFRPPARYTDTTVGYMEISADGGGEIEIGMDINYDDYRHAYRNGYPVKFTKLYHEINAVLQVISPILYNLNDLDKKTTFGSLIHAGAYHEINPRGVATYHYEDDFSSGKYVLDYNDADNVNIDNEKLTVGTDGYVDYKFDMLYPIRKTPILTAKINNTSGEAKIQISTDGTDWYDIDTNIEDGQRIEYKLQSDNELSLRSKTVFYVRVKNGCEVEDLSIDVHYIAFDIKLLNISKDEDNIFKFEQDVEDSFADVLLQYADKRLI